MGLTRSVRATLLPLITICAAVGGYAGMYRMFVNGMTESIANTAGRRAASPYIPGGVQPFKSSYTGIGAVDAWLALLVPFFAYALDTPQSWGVTASLYYLLTTYFSACCLLFLEGQRRGNAGRGVSWVGTLALICQTISYTIAAPVYFILHIFTSPTASPQVSAADVLPADPSEPRILLLTNFIAYVIPTVGMLLPAPSPFASAAAHYDWIATWQAFPVIYAGLQWVLLRVFSTLDLFGTSGAPKTGPPTKLSTAVVYRAVIAITVAWHLALLAVALTPSSGVPARWLTARKILDEVTLRSAVVPPSLFSPPSLDPKVNGAEDLAPLTHFFLVYDLYSGSVALLLWALYLRRVAAETTESFSWSSVVAKSLGWTAVGGPIAAAAALLWERDAVLVSREGAGMQKTL